MCTNKNNFAARETQYYAGDALLGKTTADIVTVSAEKYKTVFPDAVSGWSYDLNKTTALRDGKTYRYGVIGGSAREITRMVLFAQTLNPTKCDARCRNARGPMCDCSCRGNNHGKGAGSFARAHNISLPSTKRKLNIDEATSALNSMGYRMGTVRHSLADKTSYWSVTTPTGSVVEVAANKLTDFVYGKIKNLNAQRYTETTYEVLFPDEDEDTQFIDSKEAAIKVARQYAAKGCTVELSQVTKTWRSKSEADAAQIPTNTKETPMRFFKDLNMTHTGAKAKFGSDTISVNMNAKRYLTILNRVKPDEGQEQFLARVKSRLQEVVKDTGEMIRNPDLESELGGWKSSELSEILSELAGSSGGLNRTLRLWLGNFSRVGAKARMGSGDPYMEDKDVRVRKGDRSDTVAFVGQNGGGGDFYAGLVRRDRKTGYNQVLWTKYGYATAAAAERSAIKKFDAYVAKQEYSRSGAKSAFGRSLVASKGNKRIYLDGPDGNENFNIYLVQVVNTGIPNENPHEDLLTMKSYSTEARARAAAKKMLSSRVGAKSTHAVNPFDLPAKPEDWNGKTITLNGKQIKVKRTTGAYSSWLDYDLFDLSSGKRVNSVVKAQLDDAWRRGKIRDIFSRTGKTSMAQSDFKVGDQVHLGFAQKGGTGFDGIITKIEGKTVYIKSPEEGQFGARTWKGPLSSLTHGWSGYHADQHSRVGAKAEFWSNSMIPKSEVMTLHKERVAWLKQHAGQSNQLKLAEIYLEAGQGDLTQAVHQKAITKSEWTNLMHELETAFMRVEHGANAVTSINKYSRVGSKVKFCQPNTVSVRETSRGGYEIIYCDANGKLQSNSLHASKENAIARAKDFARMMGMQFVAGRTGSKANMNKLTNHLQKISASLGFKPSSITMEDGVAKINFSQRDGSSGRLGVSLRKPLLGAGVTSDAITATADQVCVNFAKGAKAKFSNPFEKALENINSYALSIRETDPRDYEILVGIVFGIYQEDNAKINRMPSLSQGAQSRLFKELSAVRHYQKQFLSSRTGAKAAFGSDVILEDIGDDQVRATAHVEGRSAGSFDGPRSQSAQLLLKALKIAGQGHEVSSGVYDMTHITLNDAAKRAMPKSAMMSRTGVKAAFAHANQQIADGVSQLLSVLGFTAMAEEAKTTTDAQTLKRMINVARSRFKGTDQADRVNVLTDKLERMLMSRTGAKAMNATRKPKPYEAVYYKWFDGVEVGIMDMGKIAKEIEAALASGANLDSVMPQMVQKYRKN